MRHLEPTGVCVLVEAQHMCMAMRGVGKSGSVTRTSAVRGVYEADSAARAEVMGLISRA